mmetsp:Transcript_9600/g.9387  ORF Transcript_9600/g.9387 Transcript_9600/m.9387 type:complete len:286 (-) Transcript_9600:5-862(-)
MFRFMEDRKKRIQVSKDFFNEFLKLMDHYNLVDEASKKIWKASMHPEEASNVPKMTATEDRAAKIEEFKKKKLIEAQIEKLKGSDDDKDIKEFWLNMIYQGIMKSISGLKSIDLEFQLLVYRDSLPAEARKPSEPPKEKKPIQMFHIPKGALAGKSYMFGDGEEAELPSQAPLADPSVVRTYQETGERVAVDVGSNQVNDRVNLRGQMEAQVFQPHWNQPTMSLEEFGEMEYQDMMRREAEEKERNDIQAAKDEETLEEEERQKAIANDNMKDEVPKGYGNTKRL